MGGRLPFFDHDKRVVAIRRQRTETRRVDERRIFDAALLGMHRGHVRLERLEYGVPLTCLGYDFHDYLDHLLVLIFLRRIASTMARVDCYGGSAPSRFAIHETMFETVSW